MNEVDADKGFVYRAYLDCCKDCVAPKRYVGCHSNCAEYKVQKQELEDSKRYVAKLKDLDAIYFDSIRHCMRHRR